jgi:ABC-type antimicrobial peptide transport system permease subunit
MKVLHDVIGSWRRLTAVFARSKRAKEIDDEVAFHLAMRRADHERGGASEHDVDLAAKRQFGNVAAVKALGLSVIGIYGVMSYLVTQRTREFGIRLALGASRVDVVRSVLQRGIWLIALGTAIGVGVAAALYQVFSTQLFEVTALDSSGALAIVTLSVVATLACIVPAIRATRVDPVTALRQ